MRVAAVYDVHGNLPALEAALREIEHADVDEIVVGGDIVLGPMPRETLERLLAVAPRARFIRGNCDRLVVDAFDGRSLDRLPQSVRDSIVWTARQLDAVHRDFLAALPETATIAVPTLGEVLFCHATPRSDDEILTVATPPDRVRPMLHGVAQSVIVCGHTHMQYDRVVDGHRLINAGSVGMPYGDAGAHWLLVGPDVRPMRTPYDLRAAADRIERTTYPDAAGFASRHVLHPPSEAEMLRLFEPGRATE